MTIDDGLVARSQRCLLVAIFWLPLTTFAAELQFSNGAGASVVIELFTSQGCDRCPSAEALLNEYVDHPELWTRYIPMAFHVDLWDHLGWKDRFARPEHLARQRDYAARRRLSSVYTPAFVVNGKEWRPTWSAGDLPASGTRPGSMQVRVDDGLVDVRLERPTAHTRPMIAHVALLGMGLVTDIEAGENRGRRSRHEFVVLGWEQRRSEDNHWQVPLPTPSTQEAQRYALVVWTSSVGSPAPLYAAGHELPPALVPEAAGATGQ